MKTNQKSMIFGLICCVFVNFNIVPCQSETLYIDQENAGFIGTGAGLDKQYEIYMYEGYNYYFRSTPEANLDIALHLSQSTKALAVHVEDQGGFGAIEEFYWNVSSSEPWKLFVETSVASTDDESWTLFSTTPAEWPPGLDNNEIIEIGTNAYQYEQTNGKGDSVFYKVYLNYNEKYIAIVDNFDMAFKLNLTIYDNSNQKIGSMSSENKDKILLNLPPNSQGDHHFRVTNLGNNDIVNFDFVVVVADSFDRGSLDIDQEARYNFEVGAYDSLVFEIHSNQGTYIPYEDYTLKIRLHNPSQVLKVEIFRGHPQNSGSYPVNEFTLNSDSEFEEFWFNFGGNDDYYVVVSYISPSSSGDNAHFDIKLDSGDTRGVGFWDPHDPHNGGGPNAPTVILVMIIFILIIGAIKKATKKKKKPVYGALPQYPQRYQHYMQPQAPLPKPTITKKEEKNVDIKRGFERAGEYMKTGIKITNKSEFVITDVSVKIDPPSALECTEPDTGIVSLGSIPPGEFQSAIFKLKPTRCVDGKVNGVVMYKDAKNEMHIEKMDPMPISSICPMLTSDGVSKDDIMAKLRSGELKSSKSSIKFKGDAKAAFQVAVNRVVGLIAVEKDEKMIGNTYFGYACYIGKTKYGQFSFATEITVTGRSGENNVLTLTVYSNEERILTGFFQEVFSDVRQHVQITEERPEVAAHACPNCGAQLDLTKAKDRMLSCEYCDEVIKLPEWH